MKQSKWGKIKEKLSDIFQFLVVIIIVIMLFLTMVASYYSVRQTISEEELPWWYILFGR